MDEIERCFCLCSVNHPDQMGICTIEATGTLRFSSFKLSSPLAPLKHVDVEVCDPCRIATLAERGAA